MLVHIHIQGSQFTGRGHIWKVAESCVPGMDTYGERKLKALTGEPTWDTGSCSGRAAIQLESSDLGSAFARTSTATA